jgi:enoyl-CoA hydratase/carnithine racemase
MGELVRIEQSDRIATITLDSQHNRNALSRQLVTELNECIDAAEADDARAIVLRHDGPAFCAGADLKERSAPPSGAPPTTSSTTASASASGSNPMVNVMRRLIETDRPTIAAVEGSVRAGGIGLMASCDLVVVRTDVTFALTEVRIGVAAAIISVPILRRVPPGKIAAAMLTGEVFDAQEARSMGLVTHVTDDVPNQVTRLTDGIALGAPRAVLETKRLLNHVPTLDLDTAFAEMGALSEELFNGPDAHEGMAAFKEKRSPVWPT